MGESDGGIHSHKRLQLVEGLSPAAGPGFYRLFQRQAPQLPLAGNRTQGVDQWAERREFTGWLAVQGPTCRWTRASRRCNTTQ